MAGAVQVLVVGPKYPSDNSRGGMATVVGLMLDQHDPRVSLTALPTYVDDTPAVRLRIAVWGLSRAVALIMAGRVDVVHVHLAHRGSVIRKSIPLLVARVRGVPAVIHAHSYDFAGWFDTLPHWAQALVRRSLPADCWLVLGDVLVTPYQERFALAPKTIRALHNPAPPVRLRPNESTQPNQPGSHSRPDALLAIALGRMGQRKGTYDLLAGRAKHQRAVRQGLGAQDDRRPRHRLTCGPRRHAVNLYRLDPLRASSAPPGRLDEGCSDRHR